MHRPMAALVAVMLCAASARAQDTDAHEVPPQEAKPEAKPTGLVIPVTILGGIRAGAAVNAGKFANDVVGVNDIVAGVDLGLEVGATVFDHFYGGLTFGGTLFVSPASNSKSLSSLLVGTEFGYLTSAHPEKPGAFFGLGVAYRAFFVSDALGNANKFDCPDALFTAALEIPAGSFVRVMPRVDLGLGAIDGNVHALFVFGLAVWLGGQVHPSTRKHH
jgi:hypothetical protein